MDSSAHDDPRPSAVDPIPSRFDFDAFVCYRRLDGTSVAFWLVRKLRAYRLPKALAAGRAPLRVYIDRTYARANDDFWEQNVLPAHRCCPTSICNGHQELWTLAALLGRESCAAKKENVA